MSSSTKPPSPGPQPSTLSSTTSQQPSLTTEQLAIAERNRQRSLLQQQKKQTSLTTNEAYQLEKYEELKVGANQDTGGGFFTASSSSDTDPFQQIKSAASKKALPLLADTRENECEECSDGFSNSFLLSNFDEKVCDQCKEMKGRHSLITRTEAKTEYLLTDVDLDRREPPLRCLLKKNPREYARSYMKLYLRLQVEERALEVWGSEEQLEEERARRDAQREGRKRKTFEKAIKDLRMQARSSIFNKRLTASHEHTFGEEEPVDSPEDDPEGEYFRQTCTSCGFEKTYEKM